MRVRERNSGKGKERMEETDWRNGRGGGKETKKKEQLRADFATDGHVTVSRPQST